ncbi:MAG: lantibiotic biosynthesis protein [Actinomycetota bacterium]|nr:lantibiotic biosynthesis protein [Actinomycetota bacterium]
MKLCSPFARHDELVAGLLTELIDRQRAEGLIDRWFYIRYADPALHLRVRLRATNDAAAGQVLQATLAWCRDQVGAGLASSSAVDAYRPEIDRYGGPLVFDDVEAFFTANSDVTAAPVALLRTEKELSAEFVAVTAVDALYQQFGLDLNERLRLAPPGDDSARARQVHREHRSYLGELLVPWAQRPDERGLAHRTLLAPLLERQTETAARAALAMDAVHARGLMIGGRAGILGSLVHMQINRLMAVDLGRESRCYALWRNVLRAVRGRPVG